MADPTKAEIMLDQVTKINALIRRFQLCKDHPIPPLRLDLWPSTKSTIKAYQENVQGRIDQLTAQRETVLVGASSAPCLMVGMSTSIRERIIFWTFPGPILKGL